MRKWISSIPHSSFPIVSHGQGEIRTHDTGLPYTGFRDRRLQPLGHLSRQSRNIAGRGERVNERNCRSLALFPQAAEELLQQRCALFRQHPAHHFWTVIQTRVPNNVGHRPGHARLLVERTKDEHAHPRQYDRAGAHRARLERDVQRAVVESP